MSLKHFIHFHLPSYMQVSAYSFWNFPGMHRIPAVNFSQDRRNGTACKKCGMTFQQLRKTGRFGCAECYDTFYSQITPIFQTLRGVLKIQVLFLTFPFAVLHAGFRLFVLEF
jgi:hypothetical protein